MQKKMPIFFRRLANKKGRLRVQNSFVNLSVLAASAFRRLPRVQHYTTKYFAPG